MDELEARLRAWEVYDQQVASGDRPRPEQIQVGDWVWWRTAREGGERPLCPVVWRDQDWFLVAYRGRECEWGWAWVPAAAITAHVPARTVYHERDRRARVGGVNATPQKRRRSMSR